MSEILIADPKAIAALERRMTALERNLHDRALAAISELRRLSVSRDDTIVVTVPAELSPAARELVVDAVRRATGHTRVLVVPAGVEISVAERAS